VGEDLERYWAAELAKASESMAYQHAMARQMEPYIQGALAMHCQMEPYLRGMGAMRRQMEPYLRVSEAVRRQAGPIIKAIEQLARDTQWLRGGGLQLPVSLQVAFTVSAEIQRLARADEPPTLDVTIEGVPATVTVEAPPGTVTVTGSGGLTLPRMGLSGQGTVDEPSSGKAERGIGKILALVLVATATWRLLVMPEQDWPAVDHYLTVLSFALPIAVFIWAKNNKPK
jgi:hypothetical protein